MIRKRFLPVLLAGCLLAGCSESGSPQSRTDGSGIEESSTVPLPEPIEAMQFTQSGVTKTSVHFIEGESQLVLTAPEGAEIYYTLDGSVPDRDSQRYTEPIVPERSESFFPACCALRAKAYFADGTESVTATQTFWTAADVSSLFHNYIVSVVGDPAEITDAPDGIFYGDNAKQRGRDSERAVSVEMIDSDGNTLFSHDAGMRVFGAASRESSIKSMKLYARKSYDPEHGKFALNLFGTFNPEGELIGEYDKLVLRNAGNDFQFAFIRDEFNQTLAAMAGYTDCESVLPVVVYLNGSYYGIQWMHEALCDDLLKSMYGGKGNGTFRILEGKEKEKKVPEDDPEEAAAAEEFNQKYAELSELDLTSDKNFAAVSEYMDVWNYLDYYAFNIYINNKDWPQNNMKVYRFEANGEWGYGSEDNQHLDGKWRWWLHDMDYAEGLYEQEETQANYNNLAEILKPESDRYAPMFAALMKRDECRQYFLGKIQQLMISVFTPEKMDETLDSLNSVRYLEMVRYFDFLEELKKTDDTIWIWYQGYTEQTKMIRNFAKERPEYMNSFLSEAFPEYQQATQTETQTGTQTETQTETQTAADSQTE